MIYKYSCQNFYSIDSKVEIRFDVNQQAPSSDVYVDEPHGRVSLIEAIIGPNAAGKTNAIKALAFIRYLITRSPSDRPLPCQAFAYNKPQKRTELAVEFSLDGRFFIYSFQLNAKRILKETIKEKNQSEQRTTTKTIFSRRWLPKTKSYSVNHGVFKLPPGLHTRQNSSVISSLMLTGDRKHIATRIFDYWHDSVVTNVWELGNLDDANLHGDKMTREAIGFFYDNQHLKTSAVNILRKLGIGFWDFNHKKSEISDKVYHSVLHQFEQGREFSLPLQYESSGTKRTILLLMHIVQALEEPGGIAAIDELDAYLHPDIVDALVKIFMSTETNPNKAQLLFSSHSHQLLSDFDKQQITLVEKNNNGATDVWRLDDVAGVRADDNYHTKYIAGAYAAKPKIG